MDIVFGVMALMAAGMIMALQSVSPSFGDLSLFELKRRLEIGDSSAKARIAHNQSIPVIMRLVYISSALLMVVLAAVLIWRWGVIGGLIAGLFVLFHGRLLDLRAITRLFKVISRRLESGLTGFILKYPAIAKFIGEDAGFSQRAGLRLGSKQELARLIDKSSSILSQNEQVSLAKSLKFEELRVDEIMTKWSDVVKVDGSDLLGPKTLDDLHKTGLSHFPVVEDGSAVGLLDISKLLTLQLKESPTASQMMDRNAVTIRPDHSLRQAVRKFSTSGVALLVVVDSTSAEVGVVWLRDCMDRLL